MEKSPWGVSRAARELLPATPILIAAAAAADRLLRMPVPCERCGGEKTPRRPDGYLLCKPCANAARRVLRSQKTRPSETPDAAYDRWLRRAYGITLIHYNKMLALQGGVCALCQRPERVVSGKKGRAKRHGHLHVDHDHKSGVVRGLLCHGCNTALGHFQDDPDLLEWAARYLRTHGSESAWQRKGKVSA